MLVLNNEKTTPVIDKTRELCQMILEQDSYLRFKDQIDGFMGNPEARELYQNLRSKQEQLIDKQRTGASLSDEEIASFEADRDALFSHEVASGFIEAQQSLEDLQDSIHRMVGLTLELGHVPSDDEVEASKGAEGGGEGGGCCGGGGEGGGCGCS